MFEAGSRKGVRFDFLSFYENGLAASFDDADAVRERGMSND
jgi:hypothetical protein